MFLELWFNNTPITDIVSFSCRLHCGCLHVTLFHQLVLWVHAEQILTSNKTRNFQYLSF